MLSERNYYKLAVQSMSPFNCLSCARLATFVYDERDLDEGHAYYFNFNYILDLYNVVLSSLVTIGEK